MITIDRQDRRPPNEQLEEELRFRIASGALRPGDRLPSTRSLGEQLGLSFHTVRKVYARLADDGLLERTPGVGYRVLERDTLPKSERLEAGAEIVQDTIRRLVSLGLDESEMSYLFEEQLELAGGDQTDSRIVFVADYTELADRVAEQLSRSLGRDVDGMTLAAAGSRHDADFAFAPFPLVRDAMERLPGADVTGIQVDITADAAAAASCLFDHQTLLLVVRFADAIGPISRMLRAATGFGGQIIAIVGDEPDARIGALIRQCDVLLYTAAAARRVRPHLSLATVHRLLDPVVPKTEIDRIRSVLPG